MFLLLAFLFLVPAASASTQCQSQEWTYLARTGKCYRVFGGNDGVGAKTWPLAAEYCRQFNTGVLASVRSEEEAIFIADLSLDDQAQDDLGGAPIWIGLTWSRELNWYWLDKSRATMLRWYVQGYPQDEATSPAGFLYSKRQFAGYFGNYPGTQNWPFVCQMNAVNAG